jgi:hypothetical protein
LPGQGGALSTDLAALQRARRVLLGPGMRRPPRPRSQRNDDHEHGDFFAVMVTISLVGSLLTAASYWIW